MMRIRTACVDAGECTNTAEPGLARFTHLLLKAPEHTWGGSYAGHMNVTQPLNWSNAYFMHERAAATNPFYDVAAATWDEQRLFLGAAVAALAIDNTKTVDRTAPPTTAPSTTTAAEAGASKLAAAINEELAAIQAPPPPADPTTAGSGYTAVPHTDWAQSFQLGQATVQLDLASGALASFVDRSGIEWGSSTTPLFRFM